MQEESERGEGRAGIAAGFLGAEYLGIPGKSVGGLTALSSFFPPLRTKKEGTETMRKQTPAHHLGGLRMT